MKKTLVSFADRALLFLLAAVVFSLYLVTLAPGITWANWGADGGDYLSAIYTGGIPHPTGYPTYLAVAKVFSLMPIGSLAFRMNIFSAACMVAATILLFWTLRHLLSSNRVGYFAAFIGALCFALSPLVWSQAVITEVYGLQALFLAAFLFLMLTSQFKSIRGFFFAGIFLGIGLGNHLTLSVLVPPFMLMPLRNEVRDPFGGRVPRNLLFSIPQAQQPVASASTTFIDKVLFQLDRFTIGPKLFGVFSGAALSYSSLFLLAASDSPVRWLNPTNLARFWQLISARMYHFYWGLPTDQDIFTKIQNTVTTLYAQFGPMGLVLLIGGSVALLNKKSRATPVIAWLFVASLLFTIGYQTEDAVVYLIPAVLVCAICIAFGVQFILNLFSTWRVPVILPISIIISFLFVQMASAYQGSDASRDNRALEYVHEVAKSAPRGAIIFTSEDKETFSLWYSQYVEGMRRDIAIVVTPFLYYDWYREVISDTYPDLVLPSPNTRATRTVLEQMNDRPSCSTSFLAEIVLDCH